MQAPFYTCGLWMCRFIRNRCLRDVVLNAERAQGNGPILLAVTHLGHVEPMFISALLERHVRWMARTEFYRYRIGAWCLNACGAFPVERAGFALPAIRRAIHLLREGEIVGMFPEGGVARGADSVMHGGAIKRGVCTISIRSRIPIVPVVVLGTDALTKVGPWLPFNRGRVWAAFGHAVAPPAVIGNRRADRIELSGRLSAEFVALFEQLVTTCGLPGHDERGNTNG